MTTPADAMAALDAYAAELDQRSRELTQVERDLEPVELEYTAFVDDFEVGLWTAHENGGKLPPEAMRLKLAHRAMAPELLGRHAGLVAARGRLMKRIGVLKAMTDAQRSILSALKTELEATR